MPDKDYNYRVTVNATLSSKDFDAGAQQVENSFKQTTANITSEFQSSFAKIRTEITNTASMIQNQFAGAVKITVSAPTPAAVSQTTQAVQSALSFDSIFGASFFANLAAGVAKSIVTGFADGLADMTTYAARTEELGVALNGLAKVNHLNTASIRDQEQALKDANIATQTARDGLTKFIATGLNLSKVSPLAVMLKFILKLSLRKYLKSFWQTQLNLLGVVRRAEL